MHPFPLSGMVSLVDLGRAFCFFHRAKRVTPVGTYSFDSTKKPASGSAVAVYYYPRFACSGSSCCGYCRGCVNHNSY